MTVEEWVEYAVKSAAVIKTSIMEQEPDDSFGWGELLRTHWFSRPKRLSGSGLLLVGPPGCGKHTAAAHMIRQLNALDYDFVFLDGEDFIFAAEETGEESARTADTGRKDAKAAADRLSKLADSYYDQGQALCLVLEEMERCPNSRAVLDALGRLLCEYWLCEEYPDLFVILISEEEPIVPALLRGRLQLCRMAMPDKRRREEFLERHAKDLEHFISFDTLVSQTEGFSYAEFADAVEWLRAMVDQRDWAVPEEELVSFIKGQRPPSAEETSERETRLRVLEKAEQPLEALPQLLKDAAAAAETERVRTAAKEEMRQEIQTPPLSEKDQSLFLSEEMKQSESMPVRALTVDLWGEERAAQLIQRARRIQEQAGAQRQEQTQVQA